MCPLCTKRKEIFLKESHNAEHSVQTDLIKTILIFIQSLHIIYLLCYNSLFLFNLIQKHVGFAFSLPHKTCITFVCFSSDNLCQFNSQIQRAEVKFLPTLHPFQSSCISINLVIFPCSQQFNFSIFFFWLNNFSNMWQKPRLSF